MQDSKRELPTHLAENSPSKCFVYRNVKLNNNRSVVISYARGQDYKTVRNKAIAYAEKMNKALGPVPHYSPEGRMSSRNSSGIVRVNPKRSRAWRNGLFYYSWNTKWKGCPQHGGVSWPCIKHTDDGAYVLAALTLEMRTINRDRVIEEFEKINGTKKYKDFLKLRPQIPIEELWPDNS